MPKLTERTIQALEARESGYEVPDEDCKGLYVRVRPSGAKSFYVRYRLNGKPTGQMLGRVGELPLVRAREAVRAIRAQAKEHEAGRAESPKPERKPPVEVHTVGSWVDAYAAAVLRHRKSGDATETRLRLHFGFLFPMQLDDPEILKRVMLWRDERLHANITPKTINRDLSALSACLSEAVERDLIPEHPLRRLKPLKQTDELKVRFLSPEEEQRLMAALEAREARIRDERERANRWRAERGYGEMRDLYAAPFADYLRPLVLLLLNTGLRRGEALALVWSDIDLPNRTLTVRAQGSKTSKPRRVPLNGLLLDTLDKWRGMSPDTAPESLVFVSPKTGERLTHFRRSWDAVLKAAGITNFSVHCTRHHFASRLVQAGVPLNTVRELLGHASLQMTMRYAHLAPEHGLAAVELLSQPRGGIIPFPGSREKMNGGD